MIFYPKKNYIFKLYFRSLNCLERLQSSVGRKNWRELHSKGKPSRSRSRLRFRATAEFDWKEELERITF